MMQLTALLCSTMCPNPPDQRPIDSPYPLRPVFSNMAMRELYTRALQRPKLQNYPGRANLRMMLAHGECTVARTAHLFTSRMHCLNQRSHEVSPPLSSINDTRRSVLVSKASNFGRYEEASKRSGTSNHTKFPLRC